MIDARSIAVVLDAYPVERAALIGLLRDLDAADWDRPTECPAYSVKGIATHVLGDDLSLLSRQRDGAVQGLTLMQAELPEADLRTRLNAFNDQWVVAAAFLSNELLIELLGLAGDWTERYYRDVDPEAPGEPVGLFGAQAGSSPFWQAIAREYLERWIHHSQIRRALGLGSLAAEPFLHVGIEVASAMARMPAQIPADPDGRWGLGPVELGSAQQAADLLTRAHTASEVRELASGPPELVELLAAVAGRG
jgi:uncharacterized protein (TIGR03083 family)